MLRAVQSNNKKAVLPSGEPRDAAVNFDRYQILQWQLQEKYAILEFSSSYHPSVCIL